MMDKKEQIIEAIKSNTKIFSHFIDSGDFKKAETMLELLCFQIKYYLEHEFICTVNKDSLEKGRHKNGLWIKRER